MSTIVSPLHAASLGNARLRFFKSPTVEPEMVWHVHDDLAACLGLPRPLRRHFRHSLANGPFKDDIKTIATPDGLATIAPHYAAQGLIGAAIEVGVVSDEFETAYAHAVVAAMGVITGGWPKMVALEFALTAAKNTLRGDR